MGRSRQVRMTLELAEVDEAVVEELLFMPETYYAGAYWLGRYESAESCARRASAFFRHLSECAPDWGPWREVVRAFDSSRQLLHTPDAPSFERLFARRENQQIPDGYDYWLWTGDSPASSLHVNGACGSASSRTPSSCLLRPPIHGSLAERALNASLMASVLRAMARAWEPEWAIVTSDDFRDRVTERSSAGTFIGWLTYLSPQRGPLPRLPSTVQVEHLEDGGTLLTLTPEPLTASNPEHHSLALHVQNLLERARLLGPLQPHGAQ